MNEARMFERNDLQIAKATDISNEDINRWLKKTLIAIGNATKGKILSVFTYIKEISGKLRSWLAEANEMHRRLEAAKNEHFLKNQFYIR